MAKAHPDPDPAMPAPATIVPLDGKPEPVKCGLFTSCGMPEWYVGTSACRICGSLVVRGKLRSSQYDVHGSTATAETAQQQPWKPTHRREQEGRHTS